MSVATTEGIVACLRAIRKLQCEKRRLLFVDGRLVAACTSDQAFAAARRLLLT